MSRRRRRVAVVASTALVLTGLGSTAPLLAVEASPGDPEVVEVELVRTLELDDVGVVDPFSISASADGEQLFVAETSDPASIAVVGSMETEETRVPLAEPAAESDDFALDAATNEVLSAEDYPGDIAVDGDGTVLGVSDDQLVTVDSDDVGDRLDVSLDGLLAGPAAGLAVDSAGTIYVGDPEGDRVLELDPGGTPTRILDLRAAGVGELVDLTVAPSGDQTDDPAELSLYVIDGADAETDQRLVKELSIDEPFAAAASIPTDTATLVQSLDTGNGITPSSPDSAGITWMSTKNRLVMADSEVNEYNYYAGVNLWGLSNARPPTVLSTGTTLGWSNEPTGIAFDAANGRIFTTDDNRKRIYEVSVGADGDPGTSDDSVIRSFDTTSYGNSDPEDVVYDATHNWLHIADGSNREVFTINPGPNGVFEGGGDDIITNFDVDVDGVRDPEGIAYDPVTDSLMIIDYRRLVTAEYNLGGGLRRFVDISASNGAHPAGGTWAPASSGSGISLWVVDRGVDSSSPRDGQLYELSVPGSGPPPTPQPDVDVAPSSVSFGPVQTGATTDRTVTVANTGTATLSVSSAATSGSGFSVASGGGSFTLAAGATRPIVVRFSPTAVQSYSGALTVNSDDPDEASVVVPLSGEGVSEPTGSGEVVLEATYSGGSSGSESVATSSVVNGSTNRVYVAYVSSKSYKPVTAVTGLGGSWTSVAAQCSGRSQTSMAVFMTNNASASSVVTASLDGSPTNAAITVMAYSGVDLANPIGAVETANTNGASGGCSGGSDASSYSVNLPSVSAPSLVVGAVAIRNKSHAPGTGYVEQVEFAYGTGGGTAGLAIEDRALTTGGSVNVTGQISGNVDWAAVALVIRAADAGPPPPPPPDEPDVEVAPSSVSFGQVVAGNTSDRAVTVSNAGTATLTVSSVGASGPGFSVVSGGGSFTLAAGASHQVVVRFSPTAVQSYSGALTVNSDDPDEASVVVPLSGEGVSEPTGSGEVVLEATYSGGSSGSESVATSTMVSGLASRVYVAYVSSKSYKPVTAVTGLGGSWTSVAAQCSGRSQTSMAVFVTNNASASSVVSASLDGSPTNAVITVMAYSGVDLANPIGAVETANTNGASGGCSGGSDASSYSVNLPSVSAPSLVVGAVAIRNKSHAPGTGYVEQVEFAHGTGGGTAGLAIEDRAVTTGGTVAVTGEISSNVDWAVVALELRAALG